LLTYAKVRISTNPWFALQALCRAIDLLPDNPELFNQRCLAYIELFGYQAALKDIDRVIELAPNFFGPYLTQANIRCRLGDIRGGMESFRWAGILAQDKKIVAFTLFEMGVWATKLCGHEAGKKIFEDAHELDPENEKYAFMARVRQVTPEEQMAERRKITLAVR